MAEKIQIDYDFLKEYLESDNNVIGATTDLTLRTVETSNDSNTKYVRKFGTPYEITQVTDLTEPSSNLNFLIKTIDDETIAGRLNGFNFNTVKEKLNDNTGNNSNSIDIDSNGITHIIYYDDILNGLYYLNNLNYIWNKELILSSSSINYSRMRIDSNDKIHVALINENDEVIYLNNTAGIWSSTTVDNSTTNTESDIDLDSNNYAHIVYKDLDNLKIRYAENTAGSFSKTEIGDCDSSIGTSIAVDTSNKIHIAFSDDSDNLEYATNATGSWVNTDIFTAGLVTEGLSIDTDSNDYAHISYYDGVTVPSTQDLKYATNKSGSWVDSTIDSTGDVGRFSSINIDSSDKVHISYNDLTNTNLKYATDTTGSFVISVLDTDNTDTVKYSNLKTDSSDRINVVFNANELRAIYSISSITLIDSKAIYIQVDSFGGGTMDTTETIDTDVDPSGLTFNFPAETIADTKTVVYYLSSTTSTYYNSDLTIGGDRHTPTGTSSLPYFIVQDAIDDIGGAFTIVEILDSATYEETLLINDASTVLQSSLGQTPTLKSVEAGSRESREILHDGNNTDTIYVKKTGNDSTGDGTYQLPFLTIQHAHDNLGGKSYINILDSLEYNEDLDITNSITLEPAYGNIPILTGSGNNMTINTASAIISGFNVQYTGVSTSINPTSAGLDTEIYDCSIQSTTNGILIDSAPFSGLIKRNVIQKCSWGIRLTGTDDGSVFDGNVISRCTWGISLLPSSSPSGSVITNNIVYDCSQIGIELNGTDSGTCEDNTIFSNSKGLNIGTLTTGYTVRNIISYNNTTYDIEDEGSTHTITYSCWVTNSGFTSGAGNVNSDPIFCNDTVTPYKLGIASDSPCYRTGLSGADMGADLKHLEIQANDVVVNGIIFNGGEYTNNSIYLEDTTNYTGIEIRWCDVKEYQGIGVDLYDNDTNIESIISNCLVYNNGDGIKWAYGGNSLSESIVYNNSKFGLWSNYLTSTIDHCVFYLNQYGTYIESNSGVITITNSIYYDNSIYGIYSEISIQISYCCITDSVENIDISDSSNINDDPLFKDLTSGNEDFHLKSESGGFFIESPCVESASDGTDIGAYDTTRTITNVSWTKYVLDVNPTNMNIDAMSKGQVKFTDVLGAQSLWAKAHKISLPIKWADNRYTTETQRKKIQYLSSLIPTRENGKTKSECLIRVHLLPTTLIDTGTSATIDATAKTLTDSTKSLVENEMKGFNIAVKFDSGSNMVINATAKTGYVSGESWTVNEWTGYFLKYNGYTYYILSNTADTLTLSDPHSTLVSATITWSIEKYFEIEKNTDTVYTVIDNDSELVSGTYDYYVDFIICRVSNSKFQYSQPIYNYEKEHWKTGYSLMLEQA